MSKLAQGYDLLSKLNPEYQELLQIYSEKISNLNLPSDAKILDIASGTGNFTLEILKIFSKATIYSLEYDPVFLSYQKVKIQNLENILLINADAQTQIFKPNSFDMVSLIHALNYIPNQRITLKNIYTILKPGGYFIISDIGRQLDIRKKAKQLILYAISKYGVLKTLSYLWKVRNNIKENRVFAKNQRLGIYPTHSLNEFCQMISDAGFQIEFASDKYYGGLDDFVIARKTIFK